MHYRLFKFYLLHGIEVTKIHCVYRFEQRKWLAEYIDHNTQHRTKAKTLFEKDLHNLLNFLGKTMENVRYRKNVDFISHKQTQQRINKQTILSFKGIANRYVNFGV